MKEISMPNCEVKKDCKGGHLCPDTPEVVKECWKRGHLRVQKGRISDDEILARYMEKAISQETGYSPTLP